jgi:hypothetical protein
VAQLPVPVLPAPVLTLRTVGVGSIGEPEASLLFSTFAELQIRVLTGKEFL